MIDVESITCTHYCILFTVDLVFSATCDEMSVFEGNNCNITRIQRRTILLSVFLTWY